MHNSKNIPHYMLGMGSFKELSSLIDMRRRSHTDYCIFFIDDFFCGNVLIDDLVRQNGDMFFFVSTVEEPTTGAVNSFYRHITKEKSRLPVCVVGIGGGCTLDIAKAVANLLTNGGRAENYQGWDLVRVAGVHKIGIPTISGTGAESSRTCVMIDKTRNLKLGMNSEYTLYDQLILDAELTATVPTDQYFYTGLDTYIHCVESLGGQYRHSVGDAFSEQALRMSKQVFLSDDIQSEQNRETLMVASYLGGCAIANSFVGLVHPLSAGLSVVMGIHHCLGNCLVMNVMEEFYPGETEEFHTFLAKHKIDLPRNVTARLNGNAFDRLFDASIIHEKPLANALGEQFRTVLTRDRIRQIFERI